MSFGTMIIDHDKYLISLIYYNDMNLIYNDKIIMILI